MEKEDGVWRTIRGRRIFIGKGESLGEAMTKSGKFKREDIRKGRQQARYSNAEKKFEETLKEKEASRNLHKMKKIDSDTKKSNEKREIRQRPDHWIREKELQNENAKTRVDKNWNRYSEADRRELRHEELQKKLKDYKNNKIHEHGLTIAQEEALRINDKSYLDEKFNTKRREQSKKDKVMLKARKIADYKAKKQSNNKIENTSDLKKLNKKLNSEDISSISIATNSINDSYGYAFNEMLNEADRNGLKVKNISIGNVGSNKASVEFENGGKIDFYDLSNGKGTIRDVSTDDFNKMEKVMNTYRVHSKEDMSYDFNNNKWVNNDEDVRIKGVNNDKYDKKYGQSNNKIDSERYIDNKDYDITTRNLGNASNIAREMGDYKNAEILKRASDISKEQNDLLKKQKTIKEFKEKKQSNNKLDNLVDRNGLTSKDRRESDEIVKKFWKQYADMQSTKQFNKKVEKDHALKEFAKTNGLELKNNFNEYKLYKDGKQISYLAVDKSLSSDVRNKKYLFEGQINKNNMSKLDNGEHIRTGDSIRYEGKNEPKLYENVEIDSDGNVYYGGLKLDKKRIIGKYK